MYAIFKLRFDLQIILTVLLLVFAANHKTAAGANISIHSEMSDTLLSKSQSEQNKKSEISKKFPDYPGFSTIVLGSDITDHSNQPILQSAIQGKAAGVFIRGGSGKLGQTAQLNIRGINALYGNNQPLFVIDGIPVPNISKSPSEFEPLDFMSSFNPEDIDSIHILKDGSAAALFGSQAANGAIIIYTRRGIVGKPVFSFKTQLGYSEPSNRVKMLNREQYIKLFEESYLNYVNYTGNTGGYNNFTEILDARFPFWRDTNNPNDLSKGPDTNWAEMPFSRGLVQQYSFSVRGGGEFINYASSLGWSNQESLLISNDYNRLNGHLNIGLKPFKFLETGLTLYPSRTKSLRVLKENYLANPMRLSTFVPLDPLYIPGTEDYNNQTFYPNPLIEGQTTYSNAEISRFLTGMFGQIKFTPNFFLRTEFHTDNLKLHEEPAKATLTELNFKSKNQSFYTFLSYNRKVNYDLQVNLSGGIYTFKNLTEERFNNQTSWGSNKYGSSIVSYYGSSLISFKDRLQLFLSGRYEQNSFIENNSDFSTFISASWVIKDKPDFEKPGLLDFIRLRSSYGNTGALLPFKRGIIITYYDPDMKWPKISHFNTGLDFAIINKRLSGSLDFYSKNTVGFISYELYNVAQNFGNILNKGIELTMNSMIMDGSLKWFSSFNIAFNKNKVYDLKFELPIGINSLLNNQPAGVFWMRAYAGVDPSNGDALYYTDASRVATTNNIGLADSQVSGNPNPDFFGGWSNTLLFKRFDFSLNFQFVYGYDIYNRTSHVNANPHTMRNNFTLEYYENYWRHSGDKARYPQPRLGLNNGFSSSSLFLYDGSYLRLKDIVIGYTLNSNFTNRYGISSVRVFIKGLNMLTLTKYPGWDPESNYLEGNTFEDMSSYDYYSVPQPRTMTFGAQITF